MVAVLVVVEDGEGFVAVKGEAEFEVLPFVVVDLHGELLGAAVVVAIGGAFLLFEIADFLFELLSFSSPRDENRVGCAVDKSEAFGRGFETIGLEIV